MPRAILRHAARIGDGHERRQVVAVAPKRVGRPRADAGEAVEREPGRHLALSRPVGVALGRHRVNEAHLVGQFAKLRQQVARHRAALAPRLELPERLDEVPLLSLECDQLFAAGGRHRRVVPLHELRLVVERVDVRERARAEDHQHLLGLRGKVRRPRGVGMGRVDERPDWWLSTEQPLLVQERRQRDAREAGAAPLEEVTAVEHPAAGVGEFVSHGVGFSMVSLNHESPAAGRQKSRRRGEDTPKAPRASADPFAYRLERVRINGCFLMSSRW